MKLSSYSCGIAYATGYMAKEKGTQFLFVRNIDRWCADTISVESRNIVYKQKAQWCIKARDISVLPDLNDIEDLKSFMRAYIEIHGMLDIMNVKNRRGEPLKKLRFRIYGKEPILKLINENLPAGMKKIQHIKNIIQSEYVGETSCLYYQSQTEIENILNWLDGQPKNENVWRKWEGVKNNLK